MLEVWLKVKDELKLILKLMLKLCDHDTELESRDYNTELGLLDHYMTMALQLSFFLDISFTKYIVIFIDGLVKNLLTQ